jgi:hypothetical protein
VSYRDCVNSPRPKKLSALNGDDIRGVITLELQGLESMLGDRLGGAP